MATCPNCKTDWSPIEVGNGCDSYLCPTCDPGTDPPKPTNFHPDVDPGDHVAVAMRPVPVGVIDALHRSLRYGLHLLNDAKTNRPAVVEVSLVPMAELTDLREAAECCINLFNDRYAVCGLTLSDAVQNSRRLRNAIDAACDLGQKLEE